MATTVTRNKAVTVADLPDLFGVRGPHSFLYCTKCGEESSAHRGDYWFAPEGMVFRCHGRNMVLVVRVSALVDYRQAVAGGV